MADALANLATILALSEGETISVPVCNRWIVPSFVEVSHEDANATSISINDDQDWRIPLINYLRNGELPSEVRHKMEVRKRAPRFILYKDTLYRRSFEGNYQRCLYGEETAEAMKEAHSGFVVLISPVRSYTFKLKEWAIIGLRWSKIVWIMQGDVRLVNYTRTSYTNLRRPYILQSPHGHLIPTNYFSKWAEAVSLKKVKKETVVEFIRSHLIFRHGIPRYIITDNGKPFYNKLMDKLCVQFGFKQHNSSMYNAAANGLAEAFNKTLCNLLKKVVSKSKKDWHERVGEALWAYRTTYRTATQATPYSLVYGVEAILPLESQIPSLRIAIQEGLTAEDNARLRL
ncbi:PREDICTED: uncharacterized protein LOC105976307 [Erythranthe guttata]|uniref:uncharacterized protein LOC105976307 n=1 Tax=Erythranthe guttata TaxID=4155 RepID=UPI00064DD671|nr:PREDICTED: uncharacterized protein LOC105976307 [Erythranthe guttata]|eukprot:XP_012857035.1 PREDICTED: uncharacterized protein LOC105976307 [Erythranthe guttata]